LSAVRRLVPALLALAVAGCGTPSADLFAVERSGTVPGARLKMIVSDGGTVRCNGAKPVDITDDQLLAARELQRDLKDDAERHLDLAARPGSIFSYRVSTPDGTLRFADNSRGISAPLGRLTLFTREVAQQSCRLAR
jgi:hypothetical protein